MRRFPSRRSGRELYENELREWHNEPVVPLAILDDGTFVGHIFLELGPDQTADVAVLAAPGRPRTRMPYTGAHSGLHLDADRRGFKGSGLEQHGRHHTGNGSSRTDYPTSTDA